MLKNCCLIALVFPMSGAVNSRVGFAQAPPAAVTRRDGTKALRYSNAASGDDFSLTNRKTKNSVAILSADAVKVEKGKLSLVAKIPNSAGIAVRVAAFVGAAQGFQKTGN